MLTCFTFFNQSTIDLSGVMVRSVKKYRSRSRGPVIPNIT